ncbi:putative membrane protein [Mucilaginibacter sp. UYP25]|uniref:SRPBCC family protein n=1 Tax=unclassified Mucilaginibacter TaxID=2617802 RepID=UPI003398D3F1
MTTSAMQNRYRGPAENQEPSLNLSTAERTISIATGIKLSLSGFKGLFKSPFSSIIKLGAGGYLLNRGLTGHCELYSRMGRNSTEPVNVNIRTSYHIDKPRQEVYDFWRKLDNLPLFMKHLESVDVIDNKRSHWVLKLPIGSAKVSWDAEIVRDEPGYSIGWSSIPDSLIDNAGKVRFQDSVDGSGTLVDIIISYRPPAGGFGGGIAHILNPVFKSMVDSDVRNFKQYMDIDGGIASDVSYINDNDYAEPVAIVIEETIIEDDASEYTPSNDTNEPISPYRSHIEPIENKPNSGADNAVM